MTCTDCGTAMETKRGNYRYDDCGLPFVVLEDIEISRCAKCGATSAAISSVEKMHRAIASHVAQKGTRLTPDETRFLRKYLGFTGADFAQIVGVDAATVSRWENGLRPISPVADRLVRMLAIAQDPDRAELIEKLRRIDASTAQPVRIGLARSAAGVWDLARDQVAPGST